MESLPDTDETLLMMPNSVEAGPRGGRVGGGRAPRTAPTRSPTVDEEATGTFDLAPAKPDVDALRATKILKRDLVFRIISSSASIWLRPNAVTDEE